jgi:arylsulfatase A-like enzyme/Flp pilus assembly protein TadD
MACTGSQPVVEPTPPPRVDLVLITIDTARADRIGAYGDPLARTPNLDALASQSVLFREARTPVPLTLPAHASILSGRYPHEHGLRDNGGFRLDDDVPLIAEQLQAAGWHTGAFVGAYVLDGAWGLDRGFDVYGDDFHPEQVAQAAAFGAVERPGREVVQNALAWWDATDGPRFLWVHLFDAHRPYEPSADWKGDPYRGEMFEVDRALRPLLQTVGPDAVVVVAGDHGEGLWDHGELEHGLHLSRSVVRVPLLIRPPGGVNTSTPAVPRQLPNRPAQWAPVDGIGPEGLVLDVVPDAPVAAIVVDTPVSLVDIAPTLMALADVPFEGSGRSLVATLRGESLSTVPVFTESLYPWLHYGWTAPFAVRTESLVLRTEGDARFEPSDPWQQSPGPADGAALDALSADYTEVQAGALSTEEAEMIRALGYATSTPSGREPRPVRMDLLYDVARAQGKLGSDPRQAADELMAAVAEDGGLVDAWFSLGAARLALADGTGAKEAYERVIALDPGHVLALNNLVIIHRALGEHDAALAVVDRLMALNPTDARWHRHRVDLYGRKEDPARVRDAAAQGLELVPTDPYLHYMAGLAALQLGDAEAALVSLSRAREHGSIAPDLPMWEGKAHQELGHVDEAVEAYRQVAAGGDIRPVVAAGMLLAENKRCNDALPFLLTALERGLSDPTVLQTYRDCGGIGY